MAELETAVSGPNTVLDTFSDSLQNHALEQFSAWETEPQLTTRPQITQTLNQGSSHTAMLVVADDETSTRPFILRYCNRPSTPLGLSFGQEIACMKLANTRGLAPQILWLDIERQSMVIEFLDQSGPVSCEELVALVRSIHSLPTELPPLNLQHQFEHYWQVALEQGRSASVLINPEEPALLSAIKALESESPVTCHNDLTPPNIRRRHQELVAIDWEYASTGSPHFDIATLCCGWPDIDAGTFALEALGSRFSAQLLHIATHLYATLNWNWHQAAGEPTTCQQSPKTLLQRLEACL
jgi:aminoglycoside phosphotransferase (APT) family kinase protein